MHLYKNTPETHCDYNELVEAQTIFKEVLFFINEYKRRKDLIIKYTKQDNKNVLDKINLNTIMKKYSRIEMKFSTYLGFNNPVRYKQDQD